MHTLPFGIPVARPAIITYTVVAYRYRRIVVLHRTDLLAAEYTAELMAEAGWTVEPIKMGRAS